MHKSRLGGLIFDCQTDDLESAGEFWSNALGYDIKPSEHPQDKNYLLLDTRSNELHIEIQCVRHESRVHLDIETDNIEAEALRLEALGATRIKYVNSWLVMQAPTGQRFCLLSTEREDFEIQSNNWD